MRHEEKQAHKPKNNNALEWFIATLAVMILLLSAYLLQANRAGTIPTTSETKISEVYPTPIDSYLEQGICDKLEPGSTYNVTRNIFESSKPDSGKTNIHTETITISIPNPNTDCHTQIRSLGFAKLQQAVKLQSGHYYYTEFAFNKAND